MYQIVLSYINWYILFWYFCEFLSCLFSFCFVYSGIYTLKLNKQLTESLKNIIFYHALQQSLIFQHVV